MRSSTTLILLLLTAAAPASSSRSPQALMERIERAVVLPKEAKPLSEYGRNYAFSGPNKVIATYLIPSRPIGSSEGCEVVLEEFNTRPCTAKEIAKLARADASAVASQTPAGKRRWYDSSRSLPFISDGGCQQVTVQYDILTQHITAVSCNGHA